MVITYDPRKDAYAILGVAPEASLKEVKRAYRRAALMWHPDKSPAPDAAERFHEVKEAAAILRNAKTRREYDHLRILQLGSAARSRRRRPPDPMPHAPLAHPPHWLEERVRVHFDAVLLTLELPHRGRRRARIVDGLGIASLIVALITRNLEFGALALVFLFIARVMSKPPHQGILAWAKVVPARRLAEYHILDQRLSRYEHWSVPFNRLTVAIVAERGDWRIEIQGFPRNAVPILDRTRNREEARRRAREAGRWLKIPLAA